MGKEKVYIACVAQDFTNLLHLKAVQLRIQIETAQLGNEEFEVSARAVRFCGKEIGVESHPDEQIVCNRLVSVELHECVEDFTIDEALLFQCFKGMTEVLDHATLMTVFLGSDVPHKAAAEDVVSDPENRPEDRKAAEIFLVNLLERQH